MSLYFYYIVTLIYLIVHIMYRIAFEINYSILFYSILYYSKPQRAAVNERKKEQKSCDTLYFCVVLLINVFFYLYSILNLLIVK